MQIGAEWKQIERQVRWAWGKYVFKVGFPAQELIETYTPWYRKILEETINS